MLKKVIKTILFKLGYEIRKIQLIQTDRHGYSLYRYLKEDGSFDYERYRLVQIEGNKLKIESVWVLEENIAFLSNYIKNIIRVPQFGICHGTRRGKEQEWFSKYLGCKVIGTDISDTAQQFPNTIQWDFHEVKPEWLDTSDFIYSNSFDHSYDPEKCLNGWMRCIKKGGVCIIEHSSGHSPSCVKELDPFGSDIVQMPYLITIWGKGKYCVREIIRAPKKSDLVNYLFFIIIQRL
jgi:hypothetical protein